MFNTGSSQVWLEPSAVYVRVCPEEVPYGHFHYVELQLWSIVNPHKGQHHEKRAALSSGGWLPATHLFRPHHLKNICAACRPQNNLADTNALPRNGVQRPTDKGKIKRR